MAQPTLRDLQWFQTRHNKEYHHDINVLTKANKISHHIHHISKYAHGITDTFHEEMHSTFQLVSYLVLRLYTAQRKVGITFLSIHRM